MNLFERFFYSYRLPVIAFILLALPTSCNNQSGVRVPAGAHLVAKFRVLDEIISPQNAKCVGKIKKFLEAGLYDCSFKVEGFEFDIEDKYLVDSTGDLREFYVYFPEGPDVFSLKELAADASYMRDKGLTNFHIAIVNNAKSILDSGDTMAIERVFPAEKLILARKSLHVPRGRRFIYQYQ